jgi:hypothetical protein
MGVLAEGKRIALRRGGRSSRDPVDCSGDNGILHDWTDGRFFLDSAGETEQVALKAIECGWDPGKAARYPKGSSKDHRGHCLECAVAPPRPDCLDVKIRFKQQLQDAIGRAMKVAAIVPGLEEGDVPQKVAARLKDTTHLLGISDGTGHVLGDCRGVNDVELPIAKRKKVCVAEDVGPAKVSKPLKHAGLRDIRPDVLHPASDEPRAHLASAAADLQDPGTLLHVEKQFSVVSVEMVGGVEIAFEYPGVANEIFPLPVGFFRPLLGEKEGYFRDRVFRDEYGGAIVAGKR